MASSSVVSLHHLEVLPFDLYLVQDVLHTVSGTMESIPGMVICLDDPVNIRKD